jgi:hypothetical protein
MAKAEAKYLPEHTSYDHTIDLTTGKKSLKGPYYVHAEKELEVFSECLKAFLKTGNIR